MNIQISGNLAGQTVFLLTGFPDTSDVFNSNLIPALEKEDYRVVSLSLPGSGRDSLFSKSFYRSYEEARRRKRLRQHGGFSVLSKIKGLFCTPLFCKEEEECVYDGSKGDRGEAEGGEHTGLHSSDALFTTSFFGHNFNDLTTLLEIAVLTALRTHNYYSPSEVREEGEEVERVVNGIPEHQIPRSGAKPIFIAHGWGSMLLSELLLAHPTLFSRVVFLDVGASVFEWDKNNIKRMMELYSLPTFKGEKDGGGCEEGRGLTNHSVVSSETNLTPRSSSMSRSLSKVALDSVSGKPLRSEQQQQAIRNHLSARYASRYTPSKPRFACFQYFFIHFMQLIVVVFYLLVPKFIARWCLDFFLFGYTRPSYYYDSATYFTPEIERFSRKVNEEIQTTGNTDTLSDKRGWKVVLVAFLRGDGTDSSDNNGYTLRRGYALADVRTPRGVAKDVQKERERLQRLYRHVPSGTTLLDDASDASLNTLSNTGKRSSSIQKRLVYYESYLFPVRKEESPKQQRRRKTPRRMAVRVQVDVAWLHLRNLVGTIMSAVFGGVSRSKETENDKEEKLKRDAMYGLKRDTTEYAVTTKNPPALSTAEQKRFSPLVSQRYFFPIPVPVLFLYGDRKLFFLHSQQWCSYVKDKRNDDGVSDVVRVYGGGHYFFSEERYTERVAKRIIDFIRE